jgi:hypothetical protein
MSNQLIQLTQNGKRIAFILSNIVAILSALVDLIAMASAYEKYACRHRSVGRGRADPFFTTRIKDHKEAVARVRKALKEIEK